MTPVHEFCLAAIVFLSLPLPVFASLVSDEFPAIGHCLKRYVYWNTVTAAVLGLLVIATPLLELALTALEAIVFLACGAGMFVGLARCGNRQCVSIAIEPNAE